MQRVHFRILSPFLLLLALLVGSAAVTPVFAQEVTGGIKGIVKDETGAVVAGASVTASNPQRTYEVTTNSDGQYSFNQLPPGLYRVTAGAAGFGKTERDNILVELGRTLQVNLDVKVGQVGEVVNITSSDQPIVDVSSSKTSVNITERQIQVLPKANLNFSSVIEVAPGTRQESKSGGFQIDGASGAENVFVIDGVEVTRVVSGTLGSTKNIPLDFVKEVQVKSAGYEAEYGGATGGVINVVTKSGNNDYHGEVRLEYTSDNLRAEDNPTLRLSPLDPKQQTFEYFQNPSKKFQSRFLNPTFTASGPFIKNKLWFFASYAPQFSRTTNVIQLIKPIAAGDTAIQVLNTRQIENKSKFDYTFARLDFAPTSKLSVYANYTNSPNKTDGPNAALPLQTTSAVTFGNLRYEFQGGYVPASQFASGVTYTALPNLILSFRGGYTYLNDKGFVYDIPVNTPRIVISAPCTGPDCGPGTTTTGNATILTNARTDFDITRRTNLNFDATYIARIGGQQHVFKGGYQINRISNTVEFGNSGGVFTFFFNRTLSGQRGKFGYYQIDDFARTGDVQSSNQGIFVQDSWSIHPRVVLNLGLRFEKEFVPSFPIRADFHPDLSAEVIKSTSTKPIDFGFGDKVAPRIGGAWDVFGNGKLKLSASFSFFFDTIKYELPRGSFGGEKFLRSFRKLEQADFRGISLDNRPGDLISGPVDLRFPSNVTLPGERPTIDPDIKPFRSREYSAAVDYAIRNDLVVSARFTRKQVDRAIEDIGGVDAKGNEVFTIGNPGRGVSVDPQFFSPATPKAIREYTGLELRLDKRFTNNFYLNLSYIYSKLFGNYSGLSSSDEVSTVTGNGRISPNVNRFFDLPELNFDSRGRIATGRLATDRPNTFKAFGAYRFDYKLGGKSLQTEVGASQFIFQGTPVTTFVSSQVTSIGVPIIANGRGDLGRTEVFTQTDLVLNHFVNISENVRIKFSFNVFNLFDERNTTDVYSFLLAAGQNVSYKSLQEFLNSNGDFQSRINAQKLVLDPRYKQSNLFQGPREARFSVGIQF